MRERTPTFPWVLSFVTERWGCRAPLPKSLGNRDVYIMLKLWLKPAPLSLIGLKALGDLRILAG